MRVPGILVALAIAPGFATPAALAQDTPLCAFVKRVLTERPDEFAALKGAPDLNAQYETTFQGVTALDEETKCSLFVRRKVGDDVLPPSYSCNRYRMPLTDGKILYERHITALQACIPGAAIDADNAGEASDPFNMWWWEARTPDFVIQVDLHNIGGFINVMMGRPEGEPAMKVGVAVTDLSPPKPGAIIPEVP